MIATSRTRKSVLVRPPDPQAIDGLHQRTLSRYRPDRLSKQPCNGLRPRRRSGLYVRLVVEDSSSRRKTPAWLWALFVAGLAVFALGSFLARVDGHLYGIPILAVGLAAVVTFVALRGRYTGKR